ncbi:uncharacterized protein ACJ7VT_004687 [Polymixia lowei]
MGNLQCPAEDAAHLASIARDICPFPNYNPSPHFFNMLSINSSNHLGNHYAAVQASLTPPQLETFTQSLKTTVGREGKVTLGGVGVVALSLAVLFDTLARQAKGEWLSESGPIQGLFVRDLTGRYPPHVYTVSEYLRLVPYIANNPTRMREESERYLRQVLIDKQDVYKGKEDTTGVNMMLGQFFERGLHIHLLRIANSTVVDEIVKSVKAPQKAEQNPSPKESDAETGVGTDSVAKTRKRRIPAPERFANFQLNCDAEVASKEFLAEVQKSDNQTREAFVSCQPFNGHIQKTWMHYIAGLVWLDVINQQNTNGLIAQREDFDFKVNAIGKWAQ